MELLERFAAGDLQTFETLFRRHQDAKALKTRESMLMDELEQPTHVIIQSDATLHWEQYDIY